MPRAKPIEAYPNRQYAALCQRVLDLDGPFLVPCSKQAAASIRSEWYAWRKACLSSKTEALALGVDPERLLEIALRIVDGGLEVFPARLLKNPAIIDAALGGSAPLQSQASQALEALKRMQASE